MKTKRPIYLPMVYIFLLLFVFATPNASQAIATERLHTDLQIDTLKTNDTLVLREHPFAAADKFGPHELPATHPFVIENRTRDYAKDFPGYWILFSVLLLGLANYLFPLKFRETIMAAWDKRYFSSLEREGGLLNHWVSFFLFLNYLLSLSLLLFQSFVHLNLITRFPDQNPVILLAYGFAFFTGFYLLKYIIMFFAAWVFKTGGATETYFRNILVVNKFTGIALLPLLAVHYYNPASWLLYIAWAITALMALYKLFKASATGLGMHGFSAYHLILYLCTVEIAPVLFFIKAGINYLEI